MHYWGKGGRPQRHAVVHSSYDTLRPTCDRLQKLPNPSDAPPIAPRLSPLHITSSTRGFTALSLPKDAVAAWGHLQIALPPQRPERLRVFSSNSTKPNERPCLVPTTMLVFTSGPRERLAPSPLHSCRACSLLVAMLAGCALLMCVASPSFRLLVSSAFGERTDVARRTSSTIPWNPSNPLAVERRVYPMGLGGFRECHFHGHLTFP